MPPTGKTASAEEQQHETQEQDRLRKVKVALDVGTGVRDSVVRIGEAVAAKADRPRHHHHHHHHRHHHHEHRQAKPPAAAPARRLEDLPSFLKPDPKGLHISGEDKTEHHRGGAVSVDLLIKQTLVGNKTERAAVHDGLASLTPRALTRFVQTLQDVWRENRTEASKLKREKTTHDIEHARGELKDAQDEAERIKARAPKKAKEMLELRESLRKNRNEQVTTQARGKLIDEKALDLNRIQARVKEAGDGERKTRALEVIAKRRARLLSEDHKQAEEISELRRDGKQLQDKVDALHLDATEQTIVEQHDEARQRVAGLAAKLNRLIDDAEELPDGEIAKIIELAEKIAEAKERTQGQGVGVGLARTERKDQASVEGGAGYAGKLTRQGWKGELETELDVEDGSAKDDEAQADKKEDGGPEGDFEFDIDEDAKDANEALREAKKQRKASLTPEEALKDELEEAKEAALVHARTGIKVADAEFKRSWTAKQLKGYLDCRVAHLDAQLDIMRASVEAKAFAQKDGNNLGLATGAELELVLNMLGARVGLHATPLELDFFGEKFVASGTTVVDASLGAALKASGVAAAALGHHASGPTAALSGEAEAFVGAKVSAAGVFALDWNKKSQTAYKDELGQNFHRFLKFLGLQDPGKAPPTADGDAMDELLHEMGWGEVGDVLVAATEMRVDGKVGAGAEAKARAGFFGGVVEMKAGFGLTVGTGFSADTSLRVGVVEGARLAAIVAARAGEKLWHGAAFLADFAQNRAIPALKRWASKGGAGFTELWTKVKRALGVSDDEVVASAADDDDRYAGLEDGEEGGA